MKKRRQFTSEFKSKIALEALREQAPLHEIAQRYEVHPNQVTQWKKALLRNASSVFADQRCRRDEQSAHKRKEDRLYKQIGQLQVEVDFLKESCDQLGVAVPKERFH